MNLIDLITFRWMRKNKRKETKPLRPQPNRFASVAAEDYMPSSENVTELLARITAELNEDEERDCILGKPRGEGLNGPS